MKKSALLTATIIAAVQIFAAESPNLIRNGSFEEGLDAKGVPKHWRTEFNRGAEGKIELTEKNATSGKVAAHLVKSNTKGSVYLSQNVRLKPNTEYILELKGKRNAAHRWHYYGIRMPDTKVRAEGKIPTAGGVCPPLRFTSDSKRTLCYINLGLWGYNNNQKSTIGEMWVDEVSLRELPRITGRLENVPAVAFTTDTLKGVIFSTDYKGDAELKLAGKDGKIIAAQKLQLVPGKNSFRLTFSNAPAGPAKLEVVSADRTFKLEQKLTLQKGF